jgi:hypothetical protein
MSNYTTETLTEIVNEIRKDVKEIVIQTQRTNGRVNSLEIWRGFVTGGMAVIVFVLGYLTYFIEKHF